MRGKNKWILESISEFLDLKNYPELTEYASKLTNLTKPTIIRIPNELDEKIEKAVIETRKQFPALEGVKINIIRASIYQRLMKKPQ